MKTTLLILLTAVLFSCEKSNDMDVTPGENNLSVRDLGIQLNVNYRVQVLNNGQYMDLPGPVLVNFMNDDQVSEKNDSRDPRVNDYSLERKELNKYKIIFHALTPRCELAPCPYITSASIDSEIWKEADNVLLKRLTDVEPDTYRLVRN